MKKECKWHGEKREQERKREERTYVMQYWGIERKGERGGCFNDLQKWRESAFCYGVFDVVLLRREKDVKMQATPLIL